MRKISALVVLALLSAGLVSAQTTTKSGKKRWGHFGIKTGANFSSFRLGGLDSKSANTEGRTGFVFGVFEAIPVDERITIQPEFVYSSQGATLSTGIGPNDIYKLNYFSIPLLLKYSWFDGVKLIGGPQLDFMIKAKRNAGGTIYNETDNFTSTSIGVTAGVEHWFGKFIVLQGRYTYGINNVKKSSPEFQTINKGIQVTLGVLLQ